MCDEIARGCESNFMKEAGSSTSSDSEFTPKKSVSAPRLRVTFITHRRIIQFQKENKLVSIDQAIKLLLDSVPIGPPISDQQAPFVAELPIALSSTEQPEGMMVEEESYGIIDADIGGGEPAKSFEPFEHDHHTEEHEETNFARSEEYEDTDLADPDQPVLRPGLDGEYWTRDNKRAYTDSKEAWRKIQDGKIITRVENIV